MYQNGIQNYRRTNVVTADPKKLVLMCYEGAIDQLMTAKARMAERKYEKKGHALIVAAEGAGQDLMEETHARDASGNVRLGDIGIFLRDRIRETFAKKASK